MMLNDVQKELLRTCWGTIQANLVSVGVVTFLKLFETHPETLKHFIPDVKSLEEIELNEWYSYRGQVIYWVNGSVRVLL